MVVKTQKSARAAQDRDLEIAREVMGWKAVRREGQSDAWGKKQDKAGRWRRSKVPHYSEDPSLIVEIENRVKQLRLFEQYEKELLKRTASAAVPKSWASPAQKIDAALSVVQRSRKLGVPRETEPARHSRRARPERTERERIK